MNNMNQIVAVTLLNAINVTKSKNSTVYDDNKDAFSMILKNALGNKGLYNKKCNNCTGSDTNSLNTVLGTLNNINVNNENDNSIQVSNNTSITENKTNNKMENAIELLNKQLGKKYVWGATGPDSFDCSGLVQYIYKTALGKDIPRVSYDQSKFGKSIKRENLQVGDLVFFDTMNKGRVSHVGMYIGNNEFIHASNAKDGVKKSSLKGYYDKKYMGARRP